MGITNSFFLGFICGGLIPVILGSWSVARGHRRDRMRGGVNPRLLVAGLSLSAAALVVLVASEGYTDKAVIPTQGDRSTIGFGSTFHEDGSPVKMGDTTTPVRALIKAQAHIGKAEAAFRDSLVGVALHQGEYDLYVDWVYQYGMGAWLNSGMRRELLAGNYTAACDALLDYRKLRCVKHHLGELVAQFRWMLVSRDEFDRFLKTPADTLTDIQRAARFFYLAKSSFGARIVRPTYGISATGAPRLNLLRIEEDLSEAHLRLARVFIENKPYDQVIQRFDKPGTLFYVDPPYWDCESDYGEGLFSREDFGRLAGLLDGLKGRFILSLNDTPGVRETFANFHIEAVKTRYSISGAKKQEAAEVLISNFKRVA